MASTLVIDYGAPSPLSDRLILGCAFNALNVDLLRRLGVTAVCNLTPDDFGSAAAGFEYHCAAHEDCVEISSATLERYFAWMDAREAAGDVVFQHCHAGISRAPSFLIAWWLHRLRAHGGMDLRSLWSRYEDAIGKVRPFIQPHYALKRSILTYFDRPEPYPPMESDA